VQSPEFKHWFHQQNKQQNPPKTVTILNAGNHANKRDLSIIAGGNIKWYNGSRNIQLFLK
jgi:hypothetical protein